MAETHDAIYEFEQIWNDILALFQKKTGCPESVIQLWFRDAAIRSITDSQVVIECKRAYKRDILVGRYYQPLKETLTEFFGFEVEPEFRALDKEEPADDAPSALIDERTAASILIENAGNPNTASSSPAPDPFGEYTFDSFVVGSSNKLANAACKAVARQPATEYNPLFIYGPSGIGKTHLLYAIREEVKKLHPGMKVHYVSGENFKNQLVDAISSGTTAEFRARYRQNDVLMIDDIQFIAGKEATQEEFFHTFNDLYQEHKQIVLASDRPPREIKTLEDRLRTRFEWGMIADIKAPDLELRSAILKSKAAKLNTVLPDDVLEYLAENLTDNVRNLECAINRIRASIDLVGEGITLDLAKKCVSDLISPPEPSNVTAARILTIVSRHYNVSVEDIKSRKRTQSIMTPRHVSIYMIRELTDMAFLKIAKLFGRDHSTILASYDKTKEEIAKSPALEIEIKELMEECKER